MRKLIVAFQKEAIICDNPKCDFTIENESKEFDVDIKPYVNMPCPKCGENLLTEKDYNDSVQMVKAVKFINKWFSWITIFFPEPKEGEKDTVDCNVHIHNGIHITRIEDDDK